MAKWLFSGCTNNIGNLVISANTIATDYTFVLSGMCYISVSATTDPYDYYTTSLVNKDCSACSSNAIRISGCSGEGIYIFGGSPSISLPTSGEYMYLTGYTSQGIEINGCFTVIDDGYASENIYTYPGDDLHLTTYLSCEECRDIAITPTPTPTITISPTPQVTPTPTPSSVVSGCYSATTNGDFSFIDCCGVPREGSTIGQVYCVDTNYPYVGIILSNSECTQDCNTGELQYVFSVTGTCLDSNGGVIEIVPTGGVLPYTLENTIPGIGGVLTSYDSFIYSGLTSGNYTFILNDSSGGINQSVNINVVVDGCMTLDIVNYENGLCGGQGYLVVSGDSESLPYEFLLYKNGTIFQSGSTLTNEFEFLGLLPGEYYVYTTDFGGATAQTATQIITSGGSLDFTYSVTGQSPCYEIGGVATIDSVTGTTPYTYEWADGQTGNTATGLTQGYNSVTVTDSLGCTNTKNIYIPFVGEINVVQVQTEPATCFNNDGLLKIIITGGTPPYYYSGDTGYSLSTNDTEFTLSGVTAGPHQITIQDSGYCNLTYSNTVPGTAGFTILGINTVNSQCNDNGSVQIVVGGTNSQITYTLSAETGDIQFYTTNSLSHTFENVISGNYIVSVETGSDCEYTQSITISNVSKFTVSATTTGTSCNLNNGSVYIEVFSGQTELQYPLNYVVRNLTTNQLIYQTFIPTSAITVNNLEATTYIIYVTDNNSCLVEKIFSINNSGGLSIVNSTQNCTLGQNDGSIEVIILEGSPPFTYVWSSNVPITETGSIVNNLSGGTYTVTVTDVSGCSITKTTILNCDGENVNDDFIYNVCENNFITSSGNKRSFQLMLEESFYELNGLNQNCILINAIFNANLSIIGDNINENLTESFYTGYTITDVPSDNLWATTVEGLLNQITGITQQNVNLNENEYSFVGICENDSNYDTLSNAEVNLNVSIDLTVDCVPLPTPSITPTITTTNTPTPTNTLTPTPTNN